MLIENSNDLAVEFRGHVFGGSIEPDDCRKLAVASQQLLDLRDGLGFKVGGKASILGRIPMIGGGLVIVSLVGRSARCSPVLILGVVEAEFDALLAALSREFLERIASERGRLDNVEGTRL